LTKSASIYKEEEKLDAPGQNGGELEEWCHPWLGRLNIENVKEKMYSVDKEFFWKKISCKDIPLVINGKWQLKLKKD
jgi:hypothetical protein